MSSRTSRKEREIADAVIVFSPSAARSIPPSHSLFSTGTRNRHPPIFGMANPVMYARNFALGMKKVPPPPWIRPPRGTASHPGWERETRVRRFPLKMETTNGPSSPATGKIREGGYYYYYGCVCIRSTLLIPPPPPFACKADLPLD